MLLQSNNNLYAYNHNSKYLVPIHPIVAHFALEEKQEKGINLAETQKCFEKDYSKDEIQLLYRQYLHLKKHSFFESDIKNSYGKISHEWIKESFNSTKHIVFEVTEGCNLQCTYCAYGDFYINRGERTTKSMNFTLVKKMLLYFLPIWKAGIKKNPKSQISISFYGGEPLLNYPLISQIIELCESFGFNKDFFRFSMTTNGTLIKKHQDFLINKNIHITVSLDGNKENNSYRILKSNENSFDEIVNNVHSLKEKNKNYFENNVQFISVIHSKNSMEQTLTFIKEKFGKIPLMSPLSTEDVAPEKQEQFDEMYKEIISDISKDFLLNLTDTELGKYDFLSYLRKNCQHTFNYFMNAYNAGKPITILPTGTCIPFSRKVFLSTEGRILACERISIAHSFGTISEDEGLTLDYHAIADYFNAIVFKYKEECIMCYNKNSCGLCALKVSSDSNKCEAFMDEKKFIENMAFYLSLLEAFPHLYNYSKNIVIG